MEVVEGYAGDAVAFDGENYIEVGDVTELAINGQLTILVWVKVEDPNCKSSLSLSLFFVIYLSNWKNTTL